MTTYICRAETHCFRCGRKGKRDNIRITVDKEFGVKCRGCEISSHHITLSGRYGVGDFMRWTDSYAFNIKLVVEITEVIRA